MFLSIVCPCAPSRSAALIFLYTARIRVSAWDISLIEPMAVCSNLIWLASSRLNWDISCLYSSIDTAASNTCALFFADNCPFCCSSLLSAVTSAFNRAISFEYSLIWAIAFVFSSLAAFSSLSRSWYAVVSAWVAAVPAVEPPPAVPVVADAAALDAASIACCSIWAILRIVCSTRASISPILRFMTSNSFVLSGISASTCRNRSSMVIKLLSLSVSAFILNDNALITTY